MIEYCELTSKDDAKLAEIIRENLKAKKLDIPGTVYFDDNLNYLSIFYKNNAKRFYCVLKEDGQLIGGVGLAEFEGFDSCAELQKLYLIDSVKGRGLGRDLVAFIMNKAREMGYKRMYLETHSNLDIAMALYEKMGFVEIDRPDCVCHGTMNHFYMTEL